MLWATNLKQNHRQHCVEGLREGNAIMGFTTQRDFRKGMRHSWMRSLLQVHLPNYTQTPAPASFLSIPQSPAPLLLLLLESRTSSRQLQGLQGAEQGGDEMEQSATPLHSSPGWAQRQGMGQQWTDFGKYNTVLKKDLAAWHAKYPVLCRLTGTPQGETVAKGFRWWWKATDHSCPVQDLYAQPQHCCDSSVRFTSATNPPLIDGIWELLERGTKKKGDGTYEVGQMMIRSSEEGLRSSSTHAVTRKKNYPGAKLGL